MIFKEKNEWLDHVKSEHENNQKENRPSNGAFSWTHENLEDYLSNNEIFSTETELTPNQKVISVSIKNKNLTETSENVSLNHVLVMPDHAEKNTV